MIRFRCDGCGTMLDSDGADRYIVSIEAYAAAGPLEFSHEDIRRDHTAQIKDIIRQLDQADPDTVENQVYRRFRFDLCPRCHRRYLANPIGAMDG